MEILANVSKIGIYAIFAFTLTAGLLSVSVRNIFHAALGLVFALIGIAMIFFVMQAEFLAAIQILLYVGAIMTLVIFVVMLTSRIGDQNIPTSNHWRYPVGIGILLLILALVRMIGKTPWNLKENPGLDAVQIGKELMGAYVLPFEIISIVLVVALIGAIVIARSDEK